MTRCGSTTTHFAEVLRNRVVPDPFQMIRLVQIFRQLDLHVVADPARPAQTSGRCSHLEPTAV